MEGILQSKEVLRVGIFLYQSCQFGIHFYLRKLISYQKIETAYFFQNIKGGQMATVVCTIYLNIFQYSVALVIIFFNYFLLGLLYRFLFHLLISKNFLIYVLLH